MALTAHVCLPSHHRVSLFFPGSDPLGKGGVRRWVRMSRPGLDRINPRRQEQPRAEPGGFVGPAWRTGEYFKPVTSQLAASWSFSWANSLIWTLKLTLLLFFLEIFYRVLREIPAGEELSVWYSNDLAQWYDIPTTATPTHDEKGKRVCKEWCY